MASSLLIRDTIVRHTGMFDDGAPNLHPAVQTFIDALPADQRERYLGTCAESALISDRFWTVDVECTDGRVTTVAEARPHFDGAVMLRMRQGRPPGTQRQVAGRALVSGAGSLAQR
ncbi:YwqJ-related putative deaminase [Streptomyces morookaense]|uniref:YwqJ-related putative deaminase n=1 Tax=Streptomyces morookaense TaxID=1970 RepID=UPI0033C214CF